MYGVYPFIVVPTKSTPAFSASNASSKVEISAINKIFGYFSLISLTNSLGVFPSPRSLFVQSRAIISELTSTNLSTSSIVAVIYEAYPSYDFLIIPITGKLVCSLICLISKTP